MLDLLATCAGVALFLGAVVLALGVDLREVRRPGARDLAAANQPQGSPARDGERGAPRLRLVGGDRG